MNTQKLSQLSTNDLLHCSEAVYFCIQLLTEKYSHVSENFESEIKALKKAYEQIEQEIDKIDLDGRLTDEGQNPETL